MNLPRTRPLRRIALLTVAAPLLTSCTSTIAGDGVSGEASCAALIVYHGHKYWGQGHPERDPATTGRHVTGTVPGCDDTGGQQPAERPEPVEVAELVDVPLETAFRWNGDIFVREGRELPPETRSWFSETQVTDGPTEHARR